MSVFQLVIYFLQSKLQNRRTKVILKGTRCVVLGLNASWDEAAQETQTSALIKGQNEDEGRKRMLLFLACKQEITDDWMIGVALGSRMSR